MVASDRVSIFDFVLGAVVPDKGAVLTAMTVFWLSVLFAGHNHHLAAFGRAINQYLPPCLRNNSDLQRRALVVIKLEMLPIECVVRGYLTGSGWAAYQKDGMVCGYALPPGLHDGSKLPEPLFTPSTKAEEGHDEHLLAQDVIAQYGDMVAIKSLVIFEKAAEYAAGRGIILADTKFEFGWLGDRLYLGDEVLTPDSSRLWLASDWQETAKKGQAPQGYDKQLVREWGKTVPTPFGSTGINSLKPENREHQEFVGSVAVPPEVISATTARYRKVPELLRGQDLSTFQLREMGAE